MRTDRVSDIIDPAICAYRLGAEQGFVGGGEDEEDTLGHGGRVRVAECFEDLEMRKNLCRDEDRWRLLVVYIPASKEGTMAWTLGPSNPFPVRCQSHASGPGSVIRSTPAGCVHMTKCWL